MATSDAGGSRAPGPRRPGLRPDIQGLRAVAVLTVIASHAGLAGFEGGFVGVDVFFVISGFLISHLLYREVRRHGRISLAAFYARRARRILPAAVVVTLVTLVAASAMLSMLDARSTIDDAIWTAFFAANIRFATSSVDYFAQDQAASPLQHYWSLSVEEQFYVVWPLLLLAVVVVAAARARARSERAAGSGADPLPARALGMVLLAICVASLAWSLFATATSPQTAYFSTFARAWELGVGALAALWGPAWMRRLTTRARGLLALAGLVAITVACLTYTGATAFPGYAALLPVLGSAAVLLAGVDLREDRPTPLPLRALEVAPMRVVGDWSYSLYLWHWPVLIVLEARAGDPGPVAVLAAVALVFGLSALTYRYVETPFRSGVRLSAPRSLVLYPVSLALVAAAATGSWTYLRWASGELGDDPAITVADMRAKQPDVSFADDPTEALVQASVLAARRGEPRPSDLSPDLLSVRADKVETDECDYGYGSRQLCPRGDQDAERTVVVLGDSHGQMWIPAFETIAERGGFRTYYLVKASCTAADVTVASKDTGEPWEECSEFREWTYEQLERIRPDLVVVAAAPPRAGMYVDDERVRATAPLAQGLRDGFARTFERAARAADRVVLLRDTPRAPTAPAACLGRGEGQLGRCAFRPHAREEEAARQSAEAARKAGVEVVDPRPWLCWEGECPAIVGSTVTYRDLGHLTTTYVRRLAEPLGRALGLWPRGAAAGDGSPD